MRFAGLKRRLSHFFIIPEYRFHSELSGPMDIRWEKGRLALNSASANYSYNQLHKVMRKGLDKLGVHNLPTGDILNLGMGAGSTVSILREELKLDNPITSVEYDQSIIDVAIRYFDLDRFTSHTYLHKDAYRFVMNNQSQYSLIIIDLFKDKEVDGRFLETDFIKVCIDKLIPEGALLFNFIGADVHPAATLLEHEHTEVLKIAENRVLIYRNTDKS